METSLPVRHGARPGFSLLELVVVLSIVALATAIAAPAIRSLSRSGQTAATAREMLLCLKIARWKAIVSGCRTRLTTFSRMGGGVLWYVMEKEDGAVWIPEGERHRVPEGVRIRTTGPEPKVFNPNGTSSMGSIVLSGAGPQAYRLSFNPAVGRVRLYRGGYEVGYGR